jgi:hypothetical protein
MEFLRPVIEERLNAIEEYGKDYADKPVTCNDNSRFIFANQGETVKADLLSWLIDVAEGNELTVRSLTLRILMVNFAAVHTTSMVRRAWFNLTVTTQDLLLHVVLLCRASLMSFTTSLPRQTNTFRRCAKKSSVWSSKAAGQRHPSQKCGNWIASLKNRCATTG